MELGKGWVIEEIEEEKSEEEDNEEKKGDEGGERCGKEDDS
jgi:hypothetical protein